jgi:S1-C subfamily serine protease
MGSEDGFEDDAADDLSGRPLLPPDDRLWRHPSEVGANPLPMASFTGGAGGPGDPAHAGHAGVAVRFGTDRRVWAVAVAAGAVGAFLVLAIQVASGGLHTTRTIRTVEQMTPSVPSNPFHTVTTSIDETVEAVADRLRPATVRLDVDSPAGTATGSGVLFRSDGQILTNEHLTHGATHISVITASGRRYDGTLVGSDQMTDVAVVRVHGVGPWPIALLGSATGLRTGQTVLAIGSTLGMGGGPSVSRGVVSALGRQVTSADGSELLDMIQTDAAIAAGSAGGALVDLSGAVIGLCTETAAAAAAAGDKNSTGNGTASAPQATFLNFATPIDIAHRIAEELITTGHAKHVWLGISGTDVDPIQADKLDIDGGALVDSVKAGSPAARAGLRAGDVIATLDGGPVMSMSSLMVSLRAHTPNDHVAIGVLRAAKAIPMTVTLGDLPGDT